MASRNNTAIDGSMKTTPSDPPSLQWTQLDENLINAVSRRDISKVRSLIKKKVDPTKISPHLGVAAVHQAACLEKADILKALLLCPLVNINKTDSRKRSPVHHAARDGRDECLEHLILFKADTVAVENEGLTPLHLACMLGHLGCVQLLIPTLPSLETKDTKGRTALFHASARGCATICRLLLESGANVDATDHDGRSAIMVAAENGHQAAFQYLLSRRANVNLRDKKGRDVLWYAGRQADYLLGKPSALTGTSVARENSNDDRSYDKDSRDSVSIQPILSKKWGAEFDLSRADPHRTPKNQDSNSLTTESDTHSRRISSGTVTCMTSAANRQREEEEEEEEDDDEHDRSRIAQLTEERSELKQKLNELTEENKTLIESIEESNQNLSNIRKNQLQIQVLIKDIYLHLTTSHSQLLSTNSDDESEKQELHKTFPELIKRLSLILKSFEAEGGSGTQKFKDHFVEELARSEELIKEREQEIERIKTVIKQQTILISDQRLKLQEQEESMRKYKETVESHSANSKRFAKVKETVVMATELDDVDDEHVTDVIQKLVDEYRKVLVVNQELETRSAASIAAMTFDRKGRVTTEHLENWNEETMDDLEVIDRSSTPISGRLRSQVILLRQSLENQIKILLGSDFKSVRAVSDSTIVEDLNKLSKGVESQQQTSISGTTRVDHKVDSHFSSGGEKAQSYESDSRKLRSSLASTNFEDSGFRTIGSDLDDEVRRFQVTPDELTQVLEENRLLKSEIRSLRESGWTGERNHVLKTRTSGTQTSEFAESRDKSSEMILLREVKLLRDQNSAMRAEMSVLREGRFRSKKSKRGSREEKKKNKRREDTTDSDERKGQGQEPRGQSQLDDGAKRETVSLIQTSCLDRTKHSSTHSVPNDKIAAVNSKPGGMEHGKHGTTDSRQGSSEESSSQTSETSSPLITNRNEHSIHLDNNKSDSNIVVEKPPPSKHSTHPKSTNTGAKRNLWGSETTSNVDPKTIISTANSISPGTILDNESLIIGFNSEKNSPSTSGRISHKSGTTVETNSSENETFEKMFQQNHNIVVKHQSSSSDPAGKTRQKEKVKLLSFRKKHSSQNETESIVLENEKLRNELNRLREEIKILQHQQKQHHHGESDAGQRVLLNTTYSAGSRSVNPAYQPSIQSKDPQEDNRSLDGYKFLSEDENGTLKFKSFPLSSSLLQQQQPESGTGKIFDSDEDSESMTSTTLSSSDSTSPVEDLRLKDCKKGNRGEAVITNSSKRPKGKQKRKGRMKDRNPVISSSTSWKERATGEQGNQKQCGSNQQNLEPGKEELRERTVKMSRGYHIQRSETAHEALMFSGDIEVDEAHQSEILALQRQIQDFEKQHKMIVGIYRSHLLASIQGCLDNDVSEALLRIIALQNYR